ncbi:hypothetical protein HZA76_02335 [Candidatus Roizmanbacteria bacterium]|nr:hypothetical protein [Candidatus Roizmanbacteria bacterium]
MINLDDQEKLKNLDKKNTYGSVEELSKQCVHAFEDAKKIKVDDSYKGINKIVMTGMGGSGLGARIIDGIFGLELKFPFFHLHDYDLPSWVDEKTLVVCSAFSGETEEPVQTAHQALKKGCKWMTIGSGGTIIELAKKYKVPYYHIIPTYNPSKQPRMAIGYSVVGQLMLVAKTGAIKFSKGEIDLLVKSMSKVVDDSKMSVKIDDNQAKQTALKMYKKNVIFVASRHLVGAAHTTKNQLNENSKNFSTIFEIPELNHHLMEGLRYPESNKKDMIFYFAESDLYPERIIKRYKITEDVVNQNGVGYVTYKPKSSDPLAQVFEYLQFGGYVSFYLSMLNGLDPAPIPWVDYFKVKLGQSLGQWK